MRGCRFCRDFLNRAASRSNGYLPLSCGGRSREKLLVATVATGGFSASGSGFRRGRQLMPAGGRRGGKFIGAVAQIRQIVLELLQAEP